MTASADSEEYKNTSTACDLHLTCDNCGFTTTVNSWRDIDFESPIRVFITQCAVCHREMMLSLNQEQKRSRTKFYDEFRNTDEYKKWENQGRGATIIFVIFYTTLIVSVLWWAL